MAAWPNSLPEYVQDNGYSEQFVDQAMENQMSVGPAKVRRRFTKVTRRFTMTVRMTSSQVDTFDTFWQSTLHGGTLPFDWVHPRTRGAMSFQFKNPAPRYSAAGEVVDVSFTVESI